MKCDSFNSNGGFSHDYALIFKHGIPANTIHRMKHGEAITTKTLDVLCNILDCPVSDIIEFVKSDS